MTEKGDNNQKDISRQQLSEIESYLKEAFCIDGECVFKTSINMLGFKSSLMFKLSDSKRGIFYITMSK